MAKNKTCKWGLDKVIKDLISEIAPGSEELYLSSFDETQCLKDVTKELRERKQTIDNMFVINESLSQSLSELETKIKDLSDTIVEKDNKLKMITSHRNEFLRESMNQAGKALEAEYDLGLKNKEIKRLNGLLLDKDAFRNHILEQKSKELGQMFDLHDKTLLLLAEKDKEVKDLEKKLAEVYDSIARNGI